MENKAETGIGGAQILLECASELSVDLYPKSYEADERVCTILRPYIAMLDKEGETVGNDFDFDISIISFMMCIDLYHGVSEWRKDFNAYREESDDIQDCIQKAKERFSPIEIVMLLGIYPNITKLKFRVHKGKDTRRRRNTSVYLKLLPDISISSVSIRLRKYLPQAYVDMFNKFCIMKNVCDNNVIGRDCVIKVNSVEGMLSMFADMVGELGNQEVEKKFYKTFEYFDTDELSGVGVTLVTDFGVL